MRYEFGRNWEDFIKKNFSEERVAISRKHILSFLKKERLDDLSFLDIGCGSGLSSLAAYTAGAKKLFSFDYDNDSVSTTRYLRDKFGDEARWQVTQGSVLDDAFMAGLEPADIVYSWGVLHHTGEQWKAIRLAASAVKPGGLFYIALYTADAFVDPPPQFWLDIKQRYNSVSAFERRRMELWYLWNYSLGRNLINLPGLIRQVVEYKKNRGMSYMTDIRDWLGGWPMEFSFIDEVKAFGRDQLGFELLDVVPLGANTEYLFRRP